MAELERLLCENGISLDEVLSRLLSARDQHGADWEPREIFADCAPETVDALFETRERSLEDIIIELLQQQATLPPLH